MGFLEFLLYDSFLAPTNSISSPLGLLGLSAVYTIRKTGEVVEVVASNMVECGARNEDDWVTYIDSKGEEHIKEHLNLALDFKTTSAMANVFENLYNPIKTPSTENIRLFEVTKSLVVDKDYSVEKAVSVAKEIVEATKENQEESK